MSNNIIYLPHQPIQLYKRNPTDAEKLIGLRKWADVAYHKRLGECFFLGADYCHPVLLDDKLSLQFKAATTGADLLNNNFNTAATGTTTSTTTNHLIDSAGSFTGTVENEFLVVNLTTDQSTWVDNVDSGTDLLLNEDIFQNTGDAYTVYNVNITGNWHWSAVTGFFSITSAASGSTILMDGILTVGDWYKVTLKVVDITAGSLDIKLGANTIATINSVGTHTIYGECTTNDDFQIVASSNFVGSFDSINSTIYKLQQDYTIAFYDTDDNYVTALNYTETGNSLTIGNVFISLDWNSFSLTCGAYVIAIFVGNQEPCTGQMIFNGNFASPSGWSTDSGISITGGHAEFTSVTNGNRLCNNLSCDIVAGRSYTLSWDISANLGLKNGNYTINTPEVTPPIYNAALQSGTITRTFTAETDQGGICFESTDSCTFQLDNVSLICNNPELNMADADGLSECYCVCDSHECTTLLKYRSDRPTFGEYFDDTSDYMFLRVPGRLRNLNPTDLELNAFNSAQLQMTQPYLKQQLDEEIATQLLPDYAHRSLSAALSHPDLLIDGVGYKRTGSYTANKKDETELSDVIVKVAQTNQSFMENNF